MLRLSLRLRVLLLVVAVNVAVVGAESWVLSGQLARQSRQDALDLAEEFVYTLREKLQPEGSLNVGPLLSWPSWDRFADAVLLDRNYRRGPDGEITPVGVALNPVGRARRPADLDEQAIYDAIARAIESGAAVDGVEGGREVPLAGPQGVFGACWYLLPAGTPWGVLLLRFVLPAFVFSTVLLSLGTFFALRRFVLDPVARLAAAARSVAAGDLSVRVGAPARKDELSELMGTFDVMTERVERFHVELAREVERATLSARRAEAAAMRERRLAAMGELAAGIAHEINNPLGGLINAVEVLGREELPPDKRRRYLELLAGGLERVRLTVGQLLRFTPRSARPEPTSVHPPVLDAVALVRHRAAALAVELSVSDGRLRARGGELSEELSLSFARLPRVRCQAHELAQAVLNLLVNSLDALEQRAPPAQGPRGRIEVRLSRAPGGVQIEVEDDGPGVSAEELERVSDLFYTTKPPGKGSGLGLSIVHNVIAAHGGKVELSSRTGGGFRAALFLPADERPAAEEAAP